MAEIISPTKFGFLDLVDKGVSTSKEIASELGINYRAQREARKA